MATTGRFDANMSIPDYAPPPYEEATGSTSSPGQAPLVTPLNKLARNSRLVDCPLCQHRTMTEDTVKGLNSRTELGAIALAVVTLGTFVYTPSNSTEVEHRCGNCRELLATKGGAENAIVHARKDSLAGDTPVVQS